MIVFVSYSSVNREHVEALVMALGALGHDVEFEIKIVGDPITWRQVLASIQNCDVFVAALTSASLASYTCEIEYQYAQKLGKNILPVLMEDVSMIGRNLGSVVDFRTQNAASENALAQAIADLSPPKSLPAKFPTNANWVSPLAELRQRIETLSSDDAEQKAIILNVREFLERLETFQVATSLLDLLTAQPQLHADRRLEIEALQAELQRSSVATRAAQRQRLISGAVGLSLLVAVIVFILSQVFFRLRAERSASVASTATAESIAATQSVLSLTPPTATTTNTPTSTLTPTSTPTPSSTPTFTPSATATVILATNTSVPPTSTFTSVPSLTFTATVTPFPTLTLTFTPVPPTRTFTPTPRPPTNTPLPTLTHTPTATVTPSLAPTPQLAFRPSNTPLPDLINSLPKSVYVGIEVEDTTLGLLVTGVGSTAEAAGVKEGDYVLAVDLDIVTTRTQFLDVMQTRNPFSRVTLRVRRGGGIQILTIVLSANDFTVS